MPPPLPPARFEQVSFPWPFGVSRCGVRVYYGAHCRLRRCLDVHRKQNSSLEPMISIPTLGCAHEGPGARIDGSRQRRGCIAPDRLASKPGRDCAVLLCVFSGKVGILPSSNSSIRTYVLASTLTSLQQAGRTYKRLTRMAGADVTRILPVRRPLSVTRPG